MSAVAANAPCSILLLHAVARRCPRPPKQSRPPCQRVHRRSSCLFAASTSPTINSRSHPPSRTLAAAITAITTSTTAATTHLTLAPTTWIDALMTTVHVSSTLPWWATIVTCTVALRAACTLPLALQQRKRMERLAKIVPLLKGWEQTYHMQLKGLTGGGGGSGSSSASAAKSRMQILYNEKKSELYKKYDCHPLKTLLLPWVQIPLWVTVSLALRNMAAFPAPFLTTPESPVEGFTTGGTSWFVDLAAQDPTMIFPLSIGFLHWTNIELNRSIVRASGRNDNVMVTGFFRALVLLIIPVATQVPMALNLYWATSAAFSVAQNLAFWVKGNKKQKLPIAEESVKEKTA
ncbi:Cytochrome c oxidase assembly protein cox18, mitochondrial [Geranomyces variabilis]|nr:Cytochrome c oxidase assembly protein cox18, mitochondrial [Geranomyces variabilis]